MEKITERQRVAVTNYYARLGDRYGFKALIRHIPRLKMIAWFCDPELIEAHTRRLERLAQ